MGGRKQEVAQGEENDAIVITVGFNGVIDDNEFCKRIADAEECLFFLGSIDVIGNGPSGLDVAAITAAIDYKIDFPRGVRRVDFTYIHRKPSRNKLVVNNIFHGMRRLLLAEIKRGIAQTEVSEVKFVRAVDITSTLHVVAQGSVHEVGIAQQADVATDGGGGEGNVLNALETMLKFHGVGEPADTGCYHVHELLQLLGVAQIIVPALPPSNSPAQLRCAELLHFVLRT